MRVLAMGAGGKDFAEEIFEGVKDLVVDTTDTKPGRRQRGYDALISFMVLNRIPYPDLEKTLKLWLEALNPGGEMLIMFPSLEWAARQILLAEKPSPIVNAHLFGAQRNMNDFYHGAYTLLQMRGILQNFGLKVTHVSTGEYEISGHPAEVHSIRGLK
jgi:predicted SAM-dependent methyltransferase